MTGHTFFENFSKSHQKLKIVSTAKKRVTGHTFLWKFFQVLSKGQVSLQSEKTNDWAPFFIENFSKSHQKLKLVYTAKKMCNWSHLFVETFKVPSKT